MTDSEIYSWILLATSLASQTAPTDIVGISMIADGINHAVPTEKELKTSLCWLINRKLISRENKKYKLTELGKSTYDMANSNANFLSEIWINLEIKLNKLLKP